MDQAQHMEMDLSRHNTGASGRGAFVVEDPGAWCAYLSLQFQAAAGPKVCTQLCTGPGQREVELRVPQILLRVLASAAPSGRDPWHSSFLQRPKAQPTVSCKIITFARQYKHFPRAAGEDGSEAMTRVQ